MTKASCTSLLCASIALSFLLSYPAAHAQEQVALTLPDAPGMTSALTPSVAPEDARNSSSSLAEEPAALAAQGSGAASAHQDGQTKRILGIIPNFRAVSADMHPPPQTVKDKFITTTEDSFDYSSILLPAAVSGIDQWRNDTPEFRQGAKGYARYFWHSYVDQAVENYSVEFILPVVTHEDTRYYTLGKGGFTKRAGYALSRIVITRNDQGTDTFNISEVFGAGMGAGLSNLYYPSAERTVGNTMEKYGTNVGIDALTFMFKEFWPDINHTLFHHHD